ncbi:WecB/TagA/CpsF family glycosyltransferase [Francisellaceae bacterium]|nr:WecB/TagA/CpsF family glycosyltransferase [Francisellaceae bacterium]
MYQNLNIMNYRVFIGELSKIKLSGQDKQVINTLNPHSYVTASKDEVFERALKSSDILLPDGSGIVLAAKYINKQNIKKIAGADLHDYLLEELHKSSGRCFYMGASKITLDKIHKKLAVNFPNIVVESFSPSFNPAFTDKENQEIISKINDFKPDVLFIGMTAPKQEKWLYEFKDQLNFKLAASIGAVFDFYAGTAKRSSPFWVKLHLEWLPRLLKEPRRLWQRTLVSTPLFLWEMAKAKKSKGKRLNNA